MRVGHRCLVVYVCRGQCEGLLGKGAETGCSQGVGGGFRFGVGEWRGLLVRDALVSALVCVCVAVTRWFRACLLCLPWLSCVSCVAAFGCNAVTFDFV